MKGRIYAAGGAAIAALALAVAVTTVQADEHGRHGGPRAERLDARHGHNHYYPDRGGVVHGVPGRAVSVEQGGGRYFYSGGVWYAPRGPSFLIVAAPVGVFVPVLPPFYTTVWVGGFPYYYANDTYYVWRDAENGYEVVDPPADPSVSTQAPPSDELFIYPQRGQSADSQVPPEQIQQKRGEYQRAMRACLEGRGYSVR
ncbi:MAG: hypothetical protein E6K28_10800 [Gammaproteobacteria bacterium]|nr:MAG: hypothetical protein E6K28_10800 [Gammaproteobacteria bacterium]